MEQTIDPQVDDQAVEVLRFMARNVQSRPLLYGLLMTDVERWRDLPVTEKPRVFARDIRRFSVACPALARKDRVKHALEALIQSAPTAGALGF